MHAEVDNEDGGTIHLFRVVKIMPYECMGLYITCVALNYATDLNQVNRTTKDYILTLST